MQDENLSAEGRASRLTALESQLPPELQESMRDITRYQDLQTLTQEWQESDGNPASLQQMRENLVGREAAERVTILSNTGLSDEDKERQVNTCRNQLFSKQESVKVMSMETPTSTYLD